jgi:hypothetical protein
MMTADVPITRYPDEPHPNDEHTWKSWWVRKCFNQKQPLTFAAAEWVHTCWIETKARWSRQ